MIELVSTQWDFLTAVLLAALGGAIGVSVSRFFGISLAKSLFLYFWHTFFCIVYIAYVLRAGGDAIAYYNAAAAGSVRFALGTEAVEFVAAILASVFGLSVLGIFLVFNIIGYCGLLAFCAAMQEVSRDKGKLVRRLAMLLVILPSASFWSAAIGKDAIAFLAGSLVLWSALSFRNRGHIMVLGILCMLTVRPHIAAIMVVALAVSIMGQPGMRTYQRVLVFGMAILGGYYLLPFVLTGFGLGLNSGVVELREFIELRQGYNFRGGGGIDISEMSVPMKLFTYLFRPLPFEAHSFTAIAASLDNVVVLTVSALGAAAWLRGRVQLKGANIRFLWIYSCSAWFVLATITSNLGISARQKWMFLPILLCLFVASLGRKRNVRNSVASPIRANASSERHPLCDY
jgi:hypothetical protein